MYSVLLQVQIFGMMIVWGMILGIVFDIYRFIFPSNKYKGIIQYTLDTIFWVFVTLATFLVMIFTSYGEVRLYLLLGMISGFIIYIVTASKAILKSLLFIQKVIIRIYKVVKKIIEVITIILRTIIRFLWRIIYFICFPFIWFMKFLISPIVKPLKETKLKFLKKFRRK